MPASQFTLTFHTYRDHTAVVATERVTAGAVETRKRILSADLPLGLSGLEEMRPDEMLSALVSALNARLA